ncbi:hypothetical protein UF75_5105 [Desulfosporosinus sp. I2]|nr:hypothetical protein UF75_5105 [Desulfosporosinus sp. I2]
MNDILKMVIALLLSTVIINVLMNFNNPNRIDFVGFCENFIEEN